MLLTLTVAFNNELMQIINTTELASVLTFPSFKKSMIIVSCYSFIS